MTRKKYRNLGMELMRRIFNGKVPVHVQLTVRDVTIKNTKFKSYQEAWDSIKTIREQYNM